MSVAAAAEAARDEIEKVQLDESCRWQLEYESTSEGSHPFLSHLPTPMRKSAQMVHQELLRWTTTWERWMTEVLVPNPEDRPRHNGRGTEPRWKHVKVADDRSSPVKGIHVLADMGKAERACECLRIIVARLRSSTEDQLASQSLFLWLHSKNDTIEALASVVGAQAFHRLIAQLQDLWHWAA